MTMTKSPTIDWNSRPNELPWFDRPDALSVLESQKKSGKISEENYLLLKKWVIDGYVVIDSPRQSDIDSMVGILDGLFTAQKPLDRLTLLGVRETKDGPLLSLTHEELLKIDLEVRRKMPANSNWRIHEFHIQSEGARNLFLDEQVRKTVSLIMGREAYPRSTINFMYGSSQALHQDMAVFHVFPHNYLVGAWLACEDIHPDSGPLLYYPGSHKEPLWSGFNNYPQTQLRTCTQAENQAYHDYVRKVAQKYERKEFLAKKGQCLLWHGMLFHGGAPIKNNALTRKSFVVHYLVDGVDQTQHIQGPFNWG